MQTVARNNFTTVKTEGAILPADLLQRIADGKMAGLQPADYHLAPGERLNEAITRAWNRCRGVWETFNEQRRQLPESDSGVSLTRERWLLILFQELGYGRLAFQSRGIELPDSQSSIENRQSSVTARYPISHLWQQTPIHLVNFRQELDRRDPTIKRSPHSLMQEFLNRSDEHLWGFVSNGLTLQILRDNISLTRAAYVEFDLEKMMTEQVYADFTLLWLICHQSRVETLHATSLPTDCWLEKWSQQAADQGTRALDALRNGVQKAIAALGRGFLAHPGRESERLRENLRSGALSRDDYFRQLLRLVYRLIFLFVAEDRDLLLLPEADEQARHRYATYYSAGRLRRLAEVRRGGPHPDLYRTLRRVFFLLRTGYPDLGLPPLGSFLFSERSTPALDECDIANSDLLNAIHALAFTVEGQVTRPVDYKNLGAEELGSVYESLLELHPFLNIEAATFTLEVAAGSERKTTGSYYTPSSLINSLLDSALEPVVADRLQVAGSALTGASPKGGKSQGSAALEEALLSIKVVDPACGSGHFLIAAANRLATHLARVRTGDDEPSPTARREALRDVVHHCIHGVDINEMAVELCKVGLWMETIDPGKPLGFLERNIQCGNSLIGATPALLRQGIPDEAFTPITGDDNDYCKEWKARNKKEREGQLSMRFGTEPWQGLDNLATKKAEQNQMSDETLADIRAQEIVHTQFIYSPEYEHERLQADSWCAAFVWEKTNRFDYPITEQSFRRIVDNQHNVEPWMSEEIERLRNRYQFFHWQLVFSDIFKSGGFDIILGNPPWEKINLKDEEFFAASYPEIANAPNKAKRKQMIEELQKSDPDQYHRYQQRQARHDYTSNFFRYSGCFPLTGVSRINLYSVFAELAIQNSSPKGRVGLVIASGVVTDDNNKALFEQLIQNQQLVSIWDFENREAIFPAVDSRYKFCLFCATGSFGNIEEADFAFYLTNTQQLRELERHFTLSYGDLQAINPTTRTAPTFRNQREAELTKSIYRRIKAWCLYKASDNWPGNPKTPFNMSNDSGLFVDYQELQNLGASFDEFNSARIGENVYLPLYESKLIHQFNHRYATYAGSEVIELDTESLKNPLIAIAPQYWLERSLLNERFPGNWFIAYRMITNATNERTSLATIVPERPCGHSLTIIEGIDASNAIILCATQNSFVYDYTARQKVAGTNFSHWIWKQLPIPSTKQIKQTGSFLGQSVSSSWLRNRFLELSYTAYDLHPFAQDCGYFGPPFRWSEERRFLLRCELDAAYFHLYGIARDDVAYIMDTFPIVRRKDEDAFGEYRTKRVILEIYDEMAEAIHTGQPYQTRLDPPPADPRTAHAWDETYLGPYRDPSTWWQEVERAKDEKVMEQGEVVMYQPQSATSISHSVKEPAPTFQLQSPALPSTKKEEITDPPTTHATQQPLLDVVPAPTGPRSRRLKQAMALGKDSSLAATRELVAFLADEDGNIRWLAGSSLVQRANSDVVAAIISFLGGAEAERVATARPEIQRVLGLIAETAENEAVRDAAKNRLAQLDG